MATLKRINDTYTINAPQVIIDGNLQVLGSSTSVESTNTEITDNNITLNKGEAGNGVTLGTSGITVDRGTAPFDAQLYWEESSLSWVITDSSGNANTIATLGGGGLLGNVVEDTSPELGGNLDVLNWSIYSSIANVTVDGTFRIVPPASIPTITPGYEVLFYANSVGVGGSGLNVNNGQYAGAEMVVTRRAVALSLLL